MPCETLRRQRDEACRRDPEGEECRRLSREYRQCLFEDKMNAVADAVSRSLAAIAALEYVNCRKAGGSIAECLGIFHASPFPRPGDPFFRELISTMPAREQKQALKFLQEAFLAQAKEIENELKKLK